MIIKSYFASTVEAAIAMARTEQGPDALLMNSRKALPESRHSGEYEVVFACPNEPGGSSTLPAISTSSFPGSDPLLKEIADLRKQIERIATGFNQTRSMNTSNLTASPRLAELFAELLSAEVNPDVCHSLLSAVRTRGEFMPVDQMRSALREEIRSLSRVESSLGRRGARRQIVALVGPAGCGKTTTLVKLAIQYGISLRRSTQILTVDTERIAAADQLHTCATLIGAGFQALETTQALGNALVEYQNKEIIFIDTPGYGPKDIDSGRELARFLSQNDEIDVHLVLPASMKASDLSSTVNRFSDFYPHKLLFTKLDETRTFGSVFSEAVRTGKPVSFFTAGQRIPEDLESPRADTIAALVLGEAVSKAASTAA